MGYLEGSKLELALRNRLEVSNWDTMGDTMWYHVLNSEALGVELGQQGIGDIAFVLEPMPTDLHVRHSCFAKWCFW